MSQLSSSDAECAGKRKKTRREVFLEEMEQVVPWKALLKVIEPFYTSLTWQRTCVMGIPDREPIRIGE